MSRSHRRGPGGRFGPVALAAVAWIATAAGAFAQQALLEPGVRRLLDPEIQQEIIAYGRARPLAPSPLARLYSLHYDATGRPHVGLFVQLRSLDALVRLRALGADVGAVVGEVAAVRVPLEALDSLEALPLVRVQAARTLVTVHDSSMRAIRADVVRNRSASGWTGATGTGTIIGVIDTGLDIRHPDFRSDAGATRVLALWDQTIGVTPPPGFTYGFYCTAAAIQLAIDLSSSTSCPTQDVIGHGTHVTGTAAGNGAGGEPAFRYAGVAPLADLLIVRAGDVGFSEDRVADALVWIKREAQARGRPAVVNLSFGNQFTAHDGESLFEQLIDQLAGPGFIVVAAAGNNGVNGAATVPRRLIHGRATATSATTSRLAFEIAPYQPGASRCTGNVLALSVWYNVSDRVQVTLTRPNGTTALASAGAVASVESNDVDGRITIENAFPLSSYPRTAEAYIQVDGCNTSGAPAAGRWELQLTPQPAGAATGEAMDVYLHTVALGASGVAYGTEGFDNRFVVGSPGNARGAVTVGAFVTRSCWPTFSGSDVCYTRPETQGEIAAFSSGGPTRDGRAKPDIAAPGMGIMSARSRDRSAPPARLGPGGAHWVLEGTSMAAPHVTGAIALLLEQRPTLSREDISSIFAQAARQDAFTAGVYDFSAGAQPRDWWGYGKLDVVAALARLGSGGAVASMRITPRTDTLPQGASQQLRAEAANALGEVVFAPVMWTSLDPTIATVDFAGTVRALQPGIARIAAAAESVADTMRMTVLPPAVLAVTGRSVSPASPVVGSRGATVPLLALRLEAQGPEAIDVRALGFELNGTDTNIDVEVFDDPAGDGLLDPGARSLGRLHVSALAGSRAITLTTDSLLVPAYGARTVIAAVAVSGTAPNGSDYSLRVLADRIRTVNLLSLARDRVSAGPIASNAGTTTVLQQDELFALSENPIRRSSVIFNFAEIPTTAVVYTAAGGRVADLTRRIDGLSFTWDLMNDRGTRVVPGVYILVLRVRGQLIREKLMVLAREGSGP